MAAWTVEVRKDYSGYTWANTYHLDADTMAIAQQAAEEICTFESEFLHQGATVVDAKVSAWPNPGGQFFVIVPQNIPGQRNIPNPMPAEACLLVKINAVSGHKGKKWYRMCLDDGDVQNVAGKPRLAVGWGGTALFVAAAGALDNALTALGATLLIGSDPVSARSSSNLPVIAGVGFRDMDVGWYDRQN